MSGTSLDGIDVAIVDIEGRKFSTAGFHTTRYPAALRRAILEISNAATTTGAISRLNFRLGEEYAEAVRETCRRTRVPLSSLELIGSHGQTVYHESRSNTLQIGEAAVLAERLGLPVVSDFRPRDIAAGGAGAPLVPFVDYLLFRHARRGRVALNIGGIANLTGIPPDGDARDAIAFDTGPGNMVMDALISEFTGGRSHFDRGGRVAARGSVNRKLLKDLLADPHYRAKPPKSAGREQYGTEFIERLKSSGASLPDLVATATVLTAATIAAGIERFVRPKMPVDDLIVSGGGAHNPRIMAQLAAYLPGVTLAASDEFGISADAKEAIAFAILAYETWRGRPGNLPSATGARRPVILGKITRV